jgi:hypothetical protein
MRPGEVFLPFPHQVRKMERVVGRHRRLAGQSFAQHGGLGALAFLNRDIGIAAEHFAASAKLAPPGFGYRGIFRGCVTVRNPWTMVDRLLESSRPERETPEVELHGTLSSDRPAILFSCDAGYFERFRRPVIDSLAAAGFRGTLFFAAVGASEFGRASIEDSADAAAAQEIALGMIPFPVAAVDLPAIASTARYLAAPAAFAAGARYLLIADLDSVFPPAAAELLDADFQSADLDLGLSFSRYGSTAFPWRAVSAAAVSVRDTEAGRLFLRVAANYIDAVFDPEVDNWGLDQAALWAAYEILRATRPATRIGNIFDLKTAIGANAANPDWIAFKADHRGF